MPRDVVASAHLDGADVPASWAVLIFAHPARRISPLASVVVSGEGLDIAPVGDSYGYRSPITTIRVPVADATAIAASKRGGHCAAQSVYGGFVQTKMVESSVAACAQVAGSQASSTRVVAPEWVAMVTAHREAFVERTADQARSNNEVLVHGSIRFVVPGFTLGDSSIKSDRIGGETFAHVAQALADLWRQITHPVVGSAALLALFWVGGNSCRQNNSGNHFWHPKWHFGP